MLGAKKKAWFAVKRHGYGVGLPIAREGWLVLVGYLVAVVCSAVLLPPLASAIVLILATAAFVYIAYVRSNREWRWRNGE